MKKYGVIIADPPWRYDRSNVEGSAEREYPVLSFDELRSLPVEALAAENSVLLLWATWPKLDEACLPLMKHWGFNYITGFPWIKIKRVSRNLWGQIEIKVPYGVGYWVRGASEVVLIGKKGNPSPPTDGFIGLLSPNLGHSRKPENLHHYAESLPGPYLELFARRRVEGWDTVGYDIDGKDIRESLKLLSNLKDE